MSLALQSLEDAWVSLLLQALLQESYTFWLEPSLII